MTYNVFDGTLSLTQSIKTIATTTTTTTTTRGYVLCYRTTVSLFVSSSVATDWLVLSQ